MNQPNNGDWPASPWSSQSNNGDWPASPWLGEFASSQFALWRAGCEWAAKSVIAKVV